MGSKGMVERVAEQIKRIAEWMKRIAELVALGQQGDGGEGSRAN